jgi:hypothetical protein
MRVLAPRLAKGSLDEIEALSPFATLSFLLKGFGQKVVIADRANPTRPLAVLEITPTPDQSGANLWSALTDYVVASDHYWSFSDYANGFFNHVNRAYPSMTAYVDARNARQIAWLEGVGFTLAVELPHYGRKDLPFKLYRRNAHQDV